MCRGWVYRILGQVRGLVMNTRVVVGSVWPVVVLILVTVVFIGRCLSGWCIHILLERIWWYFFCWYTRVFWYWKGGWGRCR